MPALPRDLDVVFVGDTQSTLSVERLVGREDNTSARTRLLRELGSVDASNVVFLGDLVARQTAKNWSVLDPCLEALCQRDVRVAAAVGNHDLMLSPARGYAALAARRLTGPRVTWQRLDVSSLRIFVLDSNRWAMGRTRWSEQALWLARELAHADEDPEVRATVLVSHHPPWTNSTVTGDEQAMLAPWLTAFRASCKTRVWLSGHVHAYERFSMREKTLVVAGSSGAPRVALRVGRRARHEDLAKVPAPSPFGWLELRTSPSEAELTFRGFSTLTGDRETFDRLRF